MNEFPSRSGSDRGKALVSAALAVLLLGSAAIAGVSCVTPEQKHVAVSGQECVTCHLGEALRATEPPHAGRMVMECGDCHDEEVWSPAPGFDHGAHYALQGAHVDASCTSCHTTGFEAGQTPTTCVGCHQDDYDGSPYPGHDAFATTCGDCHGQDAWKPANGGDHERFFPLRGAHVGVECTSCHTKGYESGDTPRECVGCHRDDYDRSPFPGHATFATTCADCHGDSAWKPATIPDHDQFFPLDGKHADASCASCHTNGYATGATPKTCIGCHQDDYDGSPYPGHDDFPTTCQDCHSTSGWTPASGGKHPESAFPIASGPHKEVECLECHDTGRGPMGAGNTICAQCHEHARAKADDQHHEEGDYTWDPDRPNFCLDCHADGSKDD